MTTNHGTEATMSHECGIGEHIYCAAPRCICHCHGATDEAAIEDAAILSDLADEAAGCEVCR